jgi:hypothetical protein
MISICGASSQGFRQCHPVQCRERMRLTNRLRRGCWDALCMQPEPVEVLQLNDNTAERHLRGGEAWKRRLRAGGSPARTAGPSPAVASAAATAATAAASRTGEEVGTRPPRSTDCSPAKAHSRLISHRRQRAGVMLPGIPPLSLVAGHMRYGLCQGPRGSLPPGEESVKRFRRRKGASIT